MFAKNKIVKVAFVAFFLFSTACFNKPAVSADYEAILNKSRAGYLEESLADIKRELKKNPENVQATFLLANIMADNGREDEAIRILEGLTNKHPELPQPQNNLAVLYAARGALKQASSVLQTLILAHPDFAVAHENLGNIYAALAKTEYKKAKQKNMGENHDAIDEKIKLLSMVVEFSGGEQEEMEPVEPVETKTDAVEAVESKPATYESVSEVRAVDEINIEEKREEEIRSEILSVINAWSAAWRERRSDRYLSFYKDSFSGSADLTPSEWRRTRAEQIFSKEWIELDISNIEVNMLNHLMAETVFLQKYSSNTFEGGSILKKSLTFENTDGRWLIAHEERL